MPFTHFAANHGNPLQTGRSAFNRRTHMGLFDGMFGHHGGGHHNTHHEDSHHRPQQYSGNCAPGYPQAPVPQAQPQAQPAMAPLRVIACPACNTTHTADARFCQQCGTSLAPKTCKQCNTQLAAGARFCAQCGTAA